MFSLKKFKTKIAQKNKKHSVAENYRVISVEEPFSVAAEAYRRLKISIDLQLVDNEKKVIQVCSAMQGEGKTLTGLNLAAVYKEGGKRVIMVDLDFRRPKLHYALHISNRNGVVGVLSGTAKLEDSIIHSEFGFDGLNAGRDCAYPTALIASEKMKLLFDRLKEDYDVIIVDGPPILAVPDANEIAKLTDGCLFVVSQSKSDKNLSKDAVEILRANKVNLLGCAFVGIEEKLSGKYYYTRKYKYYNSNYVEGASSSKKDDSVK